MTSTTRNGSEAKRVIDRDRKRLTTMSNQVRKVVREMVEESRSLWMPATVPEFHSSGNTVSFMRDHVCQSIPCVWRGAAKSWPGVLLWGTDDFGYLRGRVGHRKVSVAWTPDGRADAVVAVSNDDDDSSDEKSEGRVFAVPCHELQSVSSLLDNIQRVDRVGMTGWNEAEGVPYYSAQNSSLTNDLPELMEDLDDETISFATAAFEGSATAVNIWIGDERSVTTMHADPFENMYAVITGSKRFTLRPPCDAAVLSKPRLRRARWTRSGSVCGNSEIVKPTKAYSGWELVMQDGMTEWIDDEEATENVGEALYVELHAGDVLYLPPLWCKYSRIDDRGEGSVGKGGGLVESFENEK